MTWWDYPTNYSGGQTVNGTFDFFFEFPNYALSGGYVAGIVMFFFLFIFGILLISGVRRAMAASGFIMFIFSATFYSLGLLNGMFAIVFLLITIIGAIGAKEEASL